MVDLYTYIAGYKPDNTIYIDSIEEAESYAKRIIYGGNYVFNFDKTSYKNRFLTSVKELTQDVCIINCDSNIERFMDDLNESYGIVIFDNVKQCKDLDQFNYVIKNKIIIC